MPDPDRFSEGVGYVMVNGVFTVDGGEFTDALPGEAVLRTGPPAPEPPRSEAAKPPPFR